MKFKYWRLWLRSKPWTLQWFIYILLLRPFAETLFFLKETSPLLSPLYWIGVITPVLALMAISRYKRNKSDIDKTFNFLTLLIIPSAFMTLPGSENLFQFLNLFIKLTYVVYIYYFLRIFVQNRTDFLGILTTILYASIFPLVNLVYEVFVSPVSANPDRMEGLFADVINYSSYLLFSVIIIVYFYFQRRKSHMMIQFKPAFILFYFGIVLMGMWQIKHLISIAVFFMVVGLFLFHDMRRRSIQILLYLVVTLVVVLMYGDAFYEEVINPRMEKEIEVIQGERETSQAFHGRMWRWQWLWGNYERSSFLAKMIGYPYDQTYSKHMVGITPHNDFLRMFFFVGIIGFITYLVFLVRITRRVKYLNKSDRFVSIALLSSLVLYSITTVPTFYVGFVNMYATLFAFLALPRQVLLKYRND
jgi:hypothetical protein